MQLIPDKTAIHLKAISTVLCGEYSVTLRITALAGVTVCV